LCSSGFSSCFLGSLLRVGLDAKGGQPQLSKSIDLRGFPRWAEVNPPLPANFSIENIYQPIFFNANHDLMKIGYIPTPSSPPKKRKNTHYSLTFFLFTLCFESFSPDRYYNKMQPAYFSLVLFAALLPSPTLHERYF
jgi:hypothetical protein